MTPSQTTQPASDIAWTDTYYNGGVEGAALAEWYNTHLAAHFDATDFNAELSDVPSVAQSAPANAQ